MCGDIFVFMVCFCVDVREGVRGGVACDGFKGEGFDSQLVQLDVGDYLVDDLVVWEYKTVSDFVSSLYNESLFNEVFNQSQLYPFSFLIVEGDFNSFFYKTYFRKGKHRRDRFGTVKEYMDYQKKIVRGAMRRCRTVCNVLQFKTEAECLNEIMEQSLKCLDFKGYGGVVRPSRDYNVNPCKAPLMEIKGVGDKISDKIIDEFGLGCLNDLLGVGYDDLLSVKGVNGEMVDNFWLKVYGYVPKDNE